MSRRVGIEIVGNAASAVRAFRQTGESAGVMGRELREVSVSAQAASRAQVDAALRTDARLRQEMVAYREMASSARRGSREQIISSNLAAEAQGRLARSMGVSGVESRALSRNSLLSYNGHIRGASGARIFERDMGKSTRGILAGSGALRGLGRNLAFASTFFIGGTGITYGLRSAVTGASNLAAQIQRTGVVFRRNAGQIDAWSKTTAARIGIARAAAIQYADTLGSILERQGLHRPEAATRAQQLVQRAGDIARVVPGASPDAIVQAIGGAITGRALALRRATQGAVTITPQKIKAEAARLGLLGGSVDPMKVKVAEDQVAIAEARLADARAKHGAGSVQAIEASDRLTRANAALGKATAGATGALTDQQKTLAVTSLIMNQTASIHAKAAAESNTYGAKLADLKAEISDVKDEIGTALLPMVTKYVREGANWLSQSQNQKRVVYDVKTAVHALVTGVKFAVDVIKTAAHWANAVAHAFGGWKNTLKIAAGAFLAFKALKIAASLHNMFLEAQLASGGRGIGGLVGSLRHLKRIGPINIPLTIGGLALAVAVADIAAIMATKGDQGPGPPGDRLLGVDPSRTKTPLLSAMNTGDSGLHGRIRDQYFKEYTLYRAQKITAAQMEKWIRDHYKALVAGGAKLPPLPVDPTKLAALTKAFANAPGFGKPHKSGAGDSGDTGPSAAAAAAATAAARRRALIAHERARMAREGTQMALLGLGPSGSPLPPTGRGLKRELGNVSALIKGTVLDTATHRHLLANIRSLLSGHLGALSATVREKIKSLLDGLLNNMKQFSDGFNLTVADRHRRFLDRQRADRYNGRLDHPVVHHHHYDFTIHGHAGEDTAAMLRRAHWRMRTT